MAYKKYIVKNGKVYGPYVYHSRRVNGKVVSEYRGTNKKLNYKKFGWISLGLLGLIVLIFLAINFVEFDRTITGQAVLDLEANYQEGQFLAGILKLSLDEGELVPVSSKIIFKNAGKNYEYSLSDFVFGSTILQETDVYPEVSFTLNIISSSEEEIFGEGSKEESAEEIIEQEKTEENNIEEPQEEVAEGEIVEEPQEEVEEVAEEQEEQIEKTPEETIEEEPQEEVEEVAEEQPEETGIIVGVTNFFLSLNPTGSVILEFEKQVSGKVKVGEEFIYNLEERQTAEILSGSVKTDIKNLEDNKIKVAIKDNQIIVTTDYLEIGEKQEYIGEEGIIINLSELELIFEQGDLEILIVYGEEELVSLTTVLKGGLIKSENISEVKEEEIQEEIIKEIIEENVSKEIETFEVLTDEEKEIIFSKFGNVSVKVTKSEVINNRLIIRNELGNFWVEYSYLYEASNSSIESQIEADRIKWLKDIAKMLSQEKEEVQEVSEFLGEVSV